MCVLPQSQLSAWSLERVDMTRSQRNLSSTPLSVPERAADCVCICVCARERECVRAYVRACVRARASSLSSPFSLLPLLSPPQLLSSPPLSPPPSLSGTTRRERIPQSAHRTEGSSFREICSEKHGQCLSIRFSVKKCLVFSSL